ncbi:MAG: malic enzyme [Bacteroidetes bacterium GWA2_31_9]|nr:MAG: malic enzyme [Bacteroidetes bacterium GWA2_31_9]
MAYSPGVAEPCLEIAKNIDDVYKYTAKGNLVAVISNGTAVLGLGDIGPEAGKPVMEGKGLLFKIFADIDVFDIEVGTKDIEEFISTVRNIAPTFGGINLEDIKAPECFEIERRLKAELKIPVMHDDQHGTAIISSAALLNALELVGKKIDEAIIVINGAGAAAISCTKLYTALGAKVENVVMVDSTGVIRQDRPNLTPEKKHFATSRNLNTLIDAVKGSDVFIGLSKGNVLSQEMVKSMAIDPIVFAMANPYPEIPYADAIAARPDIIMATGRSDHPNQVNNVLGFPFIFRGALDVRATCINEEMKLAAVKALAELAKEPVPEDVNLAYHSKNMSFGREYIIPKPLDPRLIYTVAPAVAKAAMDSGVALKPIKNWEAYKDELKKRLGLDNSLIRQITVSAKRNPKRVVFAEAENYKILKAAQELKDENIAIPILLGNKEVIDSIIKENNLDLGKVEIIDIASPEEKERRNKFINEYFAKRNRKGISLSDAQAKMLQHNYYGVMLVDDNYADVFISGLTRKYTAAIRPALEVIGLQKGARTIAGMYIMMTKKGPFFFADTTVNINPTVQDLVDITLLTAKAVKDFNIVPRVGLLSYSNFSSTDNEETRKVREAVAILHEKYPELIVDGDIQANFALNPTMRNEQFPFSKLGNEPINTLIFPNLSSGNIAYKMLQEMSDVEAIGPIVLGLKKSMHILQLECSVREIVNMATIAVVDAHLKRE